MTAPPPDPAIITPADPTVAATPQIPPTARKALSRWWFAAFALVALASAAAVGFLLPARLALLPRGNGTYLIHWRLLCPALAAAFGVPILAGRLLTRPPLWLSGPLVLASGSAVSGLLRLRDPRFGGGRTLASIAFICCLVAAAIALLAADEVDAIRRRRAP